MNEMSEDQQQMQQEKKYPAPTSAKFATGALLSALPVLAHFGPTGLLLSGVAGFVAYRHGPEVYDLIRNDLSFLPSLEGRTKKEKEPRAAGERTMWERLLGVQPTEEGQQSTQEQDDEGQGEQEGREEQQEGAGERSSIPAQFQIGRKRLAAIQEDNQRRLIYFGETTTHRIALSIDTMYHVLDVASSGKGKSNRFRLAMMQAVTMCQTYFISPFANNVKAVNDVRKIEVWKPIFDRLANKKPIKDGPEILRLMTALIDEIEKRDEQESNGDFSWREYPVFVFIDELPEVFTRCPQAIELLDKIGRTGRQFCVFAWVASQSAAVKETGQSTAAQANYKTRIYGGGDRNSSNRLMKGSISMEREQALQSNGAGLTLMLADGFADSAFVRAPLVTNEAMFAYFGLPPFKIEEWLTPAMSKQPVQRLEEPAKTDLLPFTLLPKEDIQAQKTPETGAEKGKTEKGKRVKGPNEDAILDALNALEEEEKSLTLNAIAHLAGLTRHQYDEIEEIAAWAGYDLDRGRGRPTANGGEREGQ